MDRLAKHTLRDRIKSYIGTQFQEALDSIMLEIYDGSYVRIKQKHDLGSDGVLNGDTVLAAYAPETYNLRDFRRKVKGDYNSYHKNWKESCPKWWVATNLEANSNMVQFVDGLQKGSQILCIERLVDLINKQNWSTVNRIFDSLDLPKRYLTNDMVGEVVEDLIAESECEKAFIRYEKPIYIGKKIELNLATEDRDSFIGEYEDQVYLFPLIADVVRLKQANKVNSLRSKIRRAYLIADGSFSNKLETMVVVLSQEKQGDDHYCAVLRGVLIYFFEQCLFGVKVEGE